MARKETGHRLNVHFSPSVYEALENLHERTGKSMAEILRDAIALEKWVQDARDEGGRILIEQDGKVRELLAR